MSQIDNIQQFLAYVFNPGDLVEIRGLRPDGAKPLCGVFRDYRKAAKFALHINQHYNANVYFGLNPVAPHSKYGTLAQIDKGLKKTDICARATDVVYRNLYLLDFDPVRPSGTCSTESEKAASYEVATRVRAYLTEQGWAEPIIVDSGNGIHLYYKADRCGAGGENIKYMLRHLHSKFASEEVEVDKSVFKPAQLSRLPFTVNRKGQDTPARPHRQSKVFSYPEQLESVMAGKVYHLAVQGGFVSEFDRPTRSNSESAELLIDESGVLQIFEEYKEVISLDRVSHDGDIIYFSFAECPFAGRAHRGGGGQRVGHGKTTIMLRSDGIGFKCLSSDCCDYSFGDFLRLLHERTGRWPSMPIWAERSLEEIEDHLHKWGCDDFEDLEPGAEVTAEVIPEEQEKQSEPVSQPAIKEEKITMNKSTPEEVKRLLARGPMRWGMSWTIDESEIEFHQLDFSLLKARFIDKVRYEDSTIARHTGSVELQQALRNEVQRILADRDSQAAARYIGKWEVERALGLRTDGDDDPISLEEFKAMVGDRS